MCVGGTQLDLIKREKKKKQKRARDSLLLRHNFATPDDTTFLCIFFNHRPYDREIVRPRRGTSPGELVLVGINTKLLERRFRDFKLVHFFCNILMGKVASKFFDKYTSEYQINKVSSMACRKKLVIVGDGTCGKTCLLIVFSKDEFPEVYVPTVFENYVADIEVDQRQVNDDPTFFLLYPVFLYS